MSTNGQQVTSTIIGEVRFDICFLELQVVSVPTQFETTKAKSVHSISNESGLKGASHSANSKI